MEIILPTADQTNQINDMRRVEGEHMALAGRPEGPLLVYAGPCADDSNRHENGELGLVQHNKAMADAADELPGIQYRGRKNLVKPRTRGGTTGLLHQPGGVSVYGEGAQLLTQAGIGIVSEVMDESDHAVAGPWQTARWGGARNTEDSGVRQLLRPTEDELEAGIVPAAAWVKHDRQGDLTSVVNGIHTLISDKPEDRFRLTLRGPRMVRTHANPHVGLILRGSLPRPEGPLEENLEMEIVTARRTLDAEFGAGKIALGVDLSHDHAKWEGGGEAGQLTIAAALGRLMGRGIIVDMVMMESYRLPGKQSDTGKVPGLSQVDACVRQDEAVRVLRTMSDARLHQQRRLAVSI